MSISVHLRPWLLLLAALFLVVAIPHHHGNYKPVPSRNSSTMFQEERRICASLCLSGMGGSPCGDSCFNIVPPQFPEKTRVPAQSEHSNSELLKFKRARRNVCPVLCTYQLGYPLCTCPQNKKKIRFEDVDFEEICRTICEEQKLHIVGCKSCDSYEQIEQNTFKMAAPSAFAKKVNIFDLLHGKKPNDDIDWDKWCNEKCAAGDGGIACNCDVLPLSMDV